jgi:hypothetical protein
VASLLSIMFYIFLCCVGARTQIEAGCTNTKTWREVFVKAKTMAEREGRVPLQISMAIPMVLNSHKSVTKAGSY